MEPSRRPEVWAGIECTINRVGSQYFNQLKRNGHLNRPEDLDMFGSLGIKRIRYPVLWEQIAPGELKDANWNWVDERLNRLRELNICPIVGFVHHGSGPSYTSLIDPEFPYKFCEFVKAFAERYQWIEYYTPVNEPLTTARFSGLYGHWYPHGHDNRVFFRALITQCKAIVAAMKAIRNIIPKAQLVQTEDICKIYSTPLLAYQADYENERRWLSLDLLCGTLDNKHRMWAELLSCGITEAELQWFVDNPCPANIIGVNHYLTSNRFLDENLERYPEGYHGGNSRHRYADVGAVGLVQDGSCTIYSILREVWERYKLPIAITEAHLCGTREEQLRWLKEFWDTAALLCKEEVDIVAVTAWALLGSFDWNCLVTKCNGFYESGVFDIRGSRPRPTALADMLIHISRNEEFNHPVLESPGFWKKPLRKARIGETIDESTPELIQLVEETSLAPVNQSREVSSYIAPVLIIGATGTLGNAFIRRCMSRDIPYRFLSRKDVDVTDTVAIQSVISKYQPWAVVNATGFVDVDRAEKESNLCFKINAHSTALWAKACKERGVQFLSFSSDLVFDGSSRIPYIESDKVSPLNVYGHSKAESEIRVLEHFPEALVVRTSAIFGPWDKHNFITSTLSRIGKGYTVNAANDIQISPTYVPDLVDNCLDLLIDKAQGIWHLTNDGAITWANLAKLSAEMAGYNASLINSCPSEELRYEAMRPKFSVLSSRNGILLPSLEDALSRYINDCKLLNHDLSK